MKENGKIIKPTVAIITGNGFDRDLGLPSSFSDFARSNEWKDLTMAYGVYQSRTDMEMSLLWHLNNSIKPNWFDIEEAIHQFVKNHPNVSEEEAYNIRKEFDGLTWAFHRYLLRVTKDFKAAEEKLAYKFLSLLHTCPVNIMDYTFNYTKPENFLEKQPEPQEQFHFDRRYVHGSLDNKDIIIGCDIQKDEEVNRPLSFMYKYNMLKETNFINVHLAEVREVIFFGHSINEIDFCYFREFFKKASSSHNPHLDVTIITWDEDSERYIKDNIRSQGISVTDLYNNLTSFIFIHTSKIYNGDKEETKKWEDFVLRIIEDAKTEYDKKTL